MTVAEVVRHLEEVAPPGTAQEWDNVGLQVGSREATVSAALICLEITDAIVAEAERLGAELVIAHHPLIFRPLTAVSTDLPLGRLVERLLGSGIAAYAAHTNLDAAPGIGTAAALAELLGVADGRPLLGDEPGLGLVGERAGTGTVAEFAACVREVLRPARLTVVGDGRRQVARVALMPGAGGDAVVPAARAGADVLVCGDLTHHDALEALALGLAVIDAGHYATERPVVHSMAQHLRGRVGGAVDVIESSIVTDPFAAGEG